MKANAPEKIHIQPNAHDRWFEDDIPNGLPNGLFVEYVRKDAFIEKACDAYCIVCKMPNCRSSECKWISDFKGHLENI